MIKTNRLLIIAFVAIIGFAACDNGAGGGAPTYTVTFDSDGGSAVTPQTVTEGGTITAPAAPTKAFAFTAPGLYTGGPGYTFAGWFASGSAFDFNTPITADITLTAQWTDAPTNTGVAVNDVAAAITRVNLAGAANDGAYTLVMDADVSAGSQTLSVSNRQLTIIGIGGEREITRTGTGRHFTVGSSGKTITLTLGKNITLQGHDNNDTNSVVHVQNGANFIMLAGSKVIDNERTSGMGGGVNVKWSNVYHEWR